MSKFSFCKYSGCGNDFILIDNRTLFFPVEDQSFIASLCHRQFGVGADGVILLEASDSADFRMRIFNSDGGEAEMCGNGIRCLVKFIRKLGLSENSWTIQTMHRKLFVAFVGDNIRVEMCSPTDLDWGIDLLIDSQQITVHSMNTGVPHAILFVDDVETVNFDSLAKNIRHHPYFSPKGTNVNFVSIAYDGTVRCRTYERGVEAETLACGTGATAVAIAAGKIYGLQSPVYVLTRSKEILEIDFSFQTGQITDVAQITDVTMTGPAAFIFQGEYIYSTQAI